MNYSIWMIVAIVTGIIIGMIATPLMGIVTTIILGVAFVIIIKISDDDRKLQIGQYVITIILISLVGYGVIKNYVDSPKEKVCYAKEKIKECFGCCAELNKMTDNYCSQRCHLEQLKKEE